MHTLHLEYRQEEFEDVKAVMRTRNSKDKQNNGLKKKGKRTPTSCIYSIYNNLIEMAEDTKCHVCKTRNQVMKRCTRCHNVYYCSKECQINDWRIHKQNCQKMDNKKYSVNDGSIFTESKPKEKITICHRPVIDFHKAAKDLQKQKCESETITKPLNSNLAYLHFNQYKSDLPVFDESQAFCEVIVKCNKEKNRIKLQNSWNGDDVFKIFSNRLKIPLEKIKVIHKGKILTSDTIMSAISNKAIFQVIGEQAANEDGLDTGDVDLLMKQMGVDRNDAVVALRISADVVDAIIELGKK